MRLKTIFVCLAALAAALSGAAFVARAKAQGASPQTAAPALPSSVAAAPPDVAKVPVAAVAVSSGLDSLIGTRHRFGLSGPKRVALSFDDGPHPTFTPQVLEILKKEKVPATFFMLGLMVKENPAVAKLVADSGFEIGNHTVGHKDLKTFSAEQVAFEIDETQRRIEAATGVVPRLFRPPYGSINANVVDAVKRSKLVIALWSVDTNDWETKTSAASMVLEVKTEARPGYIVLMHDIRKKTVDALPQVIAALRDGGYEMVTVGQLFSDFAAAPPEKRAAEPAALKGEPAPAAPLSLSLKDSSKY